MRTSVLILLLLLGGCPGSASVDYSPDGVDPFAFPDGLDPLADAEALDASAAEDGATTTADGAEMGDAAVSAPDGQGCSLVPSGRYKGPLSGEGSGTIVFKVVAAQVGQTFSFGWFKLKSPKVETYPLVLAGIQCYKMTAAIARPGGTGGTKLRGSIGAAYKPNKKLFRGKWTMPFGEGTFKAVLQP